MRQHRTFTLLFAVQLQGSTRHTPSCDALSRNCDEELIFK